MLGSARVDEHVHVPEAIPGPVRKHAEPVGGTNRLLGLGDRDNLDMIVGPVVGPHAEHLPRAGEVELFDVLEQGNRDTHRRSLTLRRRPSRSPAPTVRSRLRT